MTDFAADRYESMPFRRCGGSGVKLPVLSLGCWQNFTEIDNARGMFRRAFDRGVTHFDFANNYGPPPGRAEEVAGEILVSDFAAHRDELILATKAGYRMWPGPYGEWGSKKYLVASLEASLKRLKVEYVDFYYSHRFDPETPLDETLGALDLIVKQGKALYAGVSSYDSAATTESFGILERLGTRLAVHQGMYSMLHRQPETSGLLGHLDRLGVGFTAFSPLHQGMLTDKYLDGVPPDSRAGRESTNLHRQVNPAMLEKVRKLHEIARSIGRPLHRVALAWCLRDPRVTSLVIGARNVQQLDDSLNAATDSPLSADELTRIEGVLSAG